MRFVLAVAMLIGSTYSLSSAATTENSCTTLGQDQFVCNNMNLLYSGLQILGEQREMVQVNFPLLESVLNDMEKTATRVIIRMQNNPHMEGLNRVRDAVSESLEFARNQDIRVFQSAIALRNTCLSCHSGAQPISQIDWKNISSQSWDKIGELCTQNGRNPFLCRNMFAMTSMIDFFRSANTAGAPRFESTIQVANELNRVAQVIQKTGTGHGGENQLNDLVEKTTTLVSLAEKKDAAAFTMTPQVVQSCNKCHGGNLLKWNPKQVEK